jgi:hypothetical protein
MGRHEMELSLRLREIHNYLGAKLRIRRMAKAYRFSNTKLSTCSEILKYCACNTTAYETAAKTNNLYTAFRML